MPYIIDTNILILLGMGDIEILNVIEQLILENARFVIPASVIAELYSKYLLSDQETKMLPIFRDSTIVSIAVATKGILVTKNVRDFKMIKEVEILRN